MSPLFCAFFFGDDWIGETWLTSDSLLYNEITSVGKAWPASKL